METSELMQTTALETEPTLAFATVVREVIDLGEGLRRLVLGGPDLEHFGAGEETLDLRFKLLVPAEGATAESIGECISSLRPGAPAPSPEEAGWYQLWLQAPVARRGVMRTYTVRGLRQERGERVLDVDLVLHGISADGVAGEGVGPAALFAAAAQEGDVLHVLGPNRHLVGAEYGGIDFRPGPAEAFLLAGDETAAPALCSILDALGRDAVGAALIEIPHPGHAQVVDAPEGVRVTWLLRAEGEAPGTRLFPAVQEAAPAWVESFGRAEGVSASEAVSAAGGGRAAELEDVDVDEVTLWESPQEQSSGGYAWIAGEAGVVKELRRHLVRDLGVDRKRVAFMGYWRAGKAGH